jgi:hypothetical protein
MLALAGTVRAAPVYSTGSAAESAYDPEPLAVESPEDALWVHMVNAGAGGFDLGGDLSDMTGRGTFTWFTSSGLFDAAVGPHELITFTEPVVSPGDVLYDQYEPLGVLFLDGATLGGGDDDVVLSAGGFVEDGVGVNANGSIEIEFAVPQAHLAVDFPGDLRIELFDGANLVWTSQAMGDFGGPGTGFFGGVVASGGTFDRVILSDPVDGLAFIDNFHYDRVPEPGTFILLLGTGSLVLTISRRGKRSVR